MVAKGPLIGIDERGELRQVDEQDGLRGISERGDPTEEGVIYIGARSPL